MIYDQPSIHPAVMAAVLHRLSSGFGVPQPGIRPPSPPTPVYQPPYHIGGNVGAPPGYVPQPGIRPPAPTPPVYQPPVSPGPIVAGLPPSDQPAVHLHHFLSGLFR